MPDRKVALRDVYRLSTSRARPVWGNGASAQELIAPGFAVHLAHVRVDPDTGEVTTLNYVAIQDVGKALNPPAVIGQVQGGALQGIGFALFEEMQYDDNGQLLTGSFMDYALPKTTQAPAIETILVEVPAPDGPFGARIVGEPPIIPGAAAVGNAMKIATSKRFTHIPIDAQTVYDKLHHTFGGSVLKVEMRFNSERLTSVKTGRCGLHVRRISTCRTPPISDRWTRMGVVAAFFGKLAHGTLASSGAC